MNWGILGHEWAIAILQAHIANDRLRHAYLFTGSPGLGRRTLALRFTQAFNCTQAPGPGEFCGSCRDCRGFEQGAHPDLALLQRAEPSELIKVDQIRELVRTLFLAPYQARYRVALLPDFERATPSAANALLKTLEEPPRQVILLLTAESPEALLPTIASRCEVLRLRQIPIPALEAGLQAQWGHNPDTARLLAHLSDGRPGFARRLAANPDLLDRRTEWLDDHVRLLSASRAARFSYAEALSKDKEQLQLVLGTWLSYWRDILLQSNGSSAALTNWDRATEVSALAAQLNPAQSYQAVAALRRTLSMLDRNVNRRLAAEVLMLDLPFL